MILRFSKSRTITCYISLEAEFSEDSEKSHIDEQFNYLGFGNLFLSVKKVVPTQLFLFLARPIFLYIPSARVHS